ncbi:MAG: metallophosphoesterase [Xenococcaceae cyanobacterium]
MKSTSPMLSDPFLQLPTENSVRVVWFTDFAGSHHSVVYGEKLNQRSEAITTKLSRLREDHKSRVAHQTNQSSGEDIRYQQTTMRDIWRHEAVVSGLTPGRRIPYRVRSIRNSQGSSEEISSDVFTLAPQPKPGKPLKILLTSDHQLMPMTAANLQKVAETIGRVDGVFFAGDLVNVPDRASEWFDDNRGGAFFPCLQGQAYYELEKDGVKTVYKGGELIQHAPLFPAIGNHEIMGRFSQNGGLNDQFNDAFPRTKAEIYYQESAQQLNPGADPQLQEAWLKANSFNTDTYEEIFTLPQSNSGGKKYYAVTFGDVRLVVLYVTNVWRSPSLDSQVRGKYQEREKDLNQEEKWGYGQHIFEPIAKGSPQYRWLEQELKSKEFEQAKYKIVMFHHPVHTLGNNIVPPYTDPLPRIQYAPDGSIQSVRYEYPQENDYIIRDLMPLLESAGVHLVFYGHSHLWNRFVSPSGINFLESSNVGNSYGAYIGEKKRPIPTDNPNLNYAATGDANGLEPVLPKIAPLVDENNQPLPYIASNNITVFSILDTRDGTVSSYYFDTSQPESEVVKFDQFVIKDIWLLFGVST